MRGLGVIPVVVLAALFALGAAAGPGRAPPQPSKAASVPDGHAVQLMEMARALEKSGQGDEALAGYTEAIESHQLDRDAQARALFARGLLLDGMNQLNDALQDYGAALILSPRFAAALNNRANVYRRLHRFAEAQHDYRASLAAGNPLIQYPYYGLGQIAEGEGKTEQARKLYARALAAAPDFRLASEKLAALNAQGPVHLHPPAEIAKAQKAPDPVVLRPPAPRPAAVRLRLPRPKPAIVHPHPPEPVAASYDLASPALKPALDRGGMGAQIQLGAWRSEAEAERGWDRAVTEADGVLGGYSPHIVAVDLPGGRYYRLRVATDKSEAKALCAALKLKGLACIPAP